MTVDELRRQYRSVAGELSERQAYRWLAGEVRSLPYPHAQAALEWIFGEPVERLFGPPYKANPTPERRNVRAIRTESSGPSWQGQLVGNAAERARKFLARTEVTNMGVETLEQLADDVRHLVVAYQQNPLDEILGEIAAAQDQAFSLLEGRQPPMQTRELYLLGGIASGLMAKASHDVGTPQDAMTQARAAYAAAENADHDGLRAWVRGLQALIAYWSGQLSDSIRFAQRGSAFAARSSGTSGIWLMANEARSFAAQGKTAEARAAIQRATETREHIRGDELDELGGLCTFNRPRQMYYAAEALSWLGPDEAERVESLATEALTAYGRASETDRAFSDEAGTRCALAIARVSRSELEGVAEVLQPVLELPTTKRIHGIVAAVKHVDRALTSLGKSRVATELSDQLQTFAANPLTLPS